MAKPDLHNDVLVLGQHPSAYLAAALLRHQTKLRVMHATIPGETATDRLVTINPELFNLHPLLTSLKRRLDLSAIYGLQFLGSDVATRSESRGKSTAAYVAHFNQVQAEMRKLAQVEEVELIHPKSIEVQNIDEQGVEVTLGKSKLRFTAIVLSGTLSPADAKRLGLPEGWEHGIVHQYAFVRCKSSKFLERSNRPLMPMSLDLLGTAHWAWLLPGQDEFQLAVEWPVNDTKFAAVARLQAWVTVLKLHGVLGAGFEFKPAAVESLRLPLAGALAQEDVASRTLLIGPAGGFYSECAEDIFPNCWSAVYAADVLKKALRETHLQDALGAYRHRWRTTLGDYLRGPHQNLRFLLPLVFRNTVMTDRLVDAILFSKSLVR